jgi:hypothetical protein
MHNGKQRTLKPMRDEQIKSDVMLVVRKENLRKANPQPGLAKVHYEEHDAKSVGGDIVSAKPVNLVYLKIAFGQSCLVIEVYSRTYNVCQV